MILNLKEGEYFGQDLKSRDDGFFKLSITTYEPQHSTENHYHDNDYISILIKGKYGEQNNNETNIITPGYILFRPSTYTHKNNFSNEGGTCFNIEFKAEWKKYLNTTLNLPEKFSRYRPGSFPGLYMLLLNFKNNHNEDAVLEFISDWLFQINQNPNFNKLQPCINNVIKILETELECFHSLTSLSEKVFVHPIYLARAFKQKTGKTIGAYQLKIKLENALSLLLNTSLPISDISFKNGFHDDAHFIHSFKSVYGISPHKFRLAVKG